MTDAILQTDFPNLTFLKRGKVRDIYDLGDSLLMVIQQHNAKEEAIVYPPQSRRVDYEAELAVRHREPLPVEPSPLGARRLAPSACA